jgi:O-antigen/teichoic acid export membrane protein
MLFSKQDFINTKWFIAEKLIQLIVGIFIIPKIFNTLGVLDLGKLKFAETFIAFFAPILFLGLSAICIRDIVFKPKRTKQILTTAFYLRIFSWIFIFSFLITYVYFFKSTELFWLYFLILFSYFVRITDVFEYYFYAIKKTNYIFTSKITSLFFIVLLQYYGVQHQFGMLYFASLLVVDFLFQGIVYILIFHFKTAINFNDWNFSMLMAKYLLKNSYPLILSSLLISLYISIDDFILKYYYGDASIGLYATIDFLVFALTWSIGFSIINALYPSLAESYKTNQVEYQEKLSALYKYMLFFGVAIGAFYTFFGNFMLKTFFNESYYAVGLPLKLFSLAPLFVFIGMIFEKHLINSNQLKKNVYRFILGCILNLILCLILIPKYDLLGAVISVLISHFFTNIGFIIFDAKNRNQLKLIFLK